LLGETEVCDYLLQNDLENNKNVESMTYLAQFKAKVGKLDEAESIFLNIIQEDNSHQIV